METVKCIMLLSAEQMKKYSLIIWDLDGTIVDPAEAIIGSVRFALDKLGVLVEDTDLLRKFVGPPLAQSFMSLSGLDAETAEKAVSFYRENFSDNGAIYRERPYRGMDELLKSIHEAGIRQIIATSKPTEFAEKIVEYNGLTKYFSAILGGNMDGTGSSKIEVVERALSVAGNYNPRETVVVGDRKYEVLAAREFGLDSIYVTYGFGSAEEISETGPTHVAKNAFDIQNIIFGSPGFLPGNSTF
jgi:phosphoglycolate phosphatase